MLLGKKAKPNVQSDWAVILNRAPTDFQRQRAIDRLMEIFHLSTDEANDLMVNTPLVLLDEISLDAAEKIREHFAQTGIDCYATNDLLQKRKCFRAIWPEAPNLAHILGSSFQTSLEEDLTSSFQLAGELKTAPQLPPARESAVRSPESELKQLTMELQRENEVLKRQFQSEQSRLEEALRRLREENGVLSARNKDLGRSTPLEGPGKSELNELRLQLEHLRTEQLKTQQALRSAQREAKQFQDDGAQVQKMLSEARAECEDLKHMLDQAQMNCVQLKEEADRANCDVDERLRMQRTELEEWKRKANDWSAGYSQVIKENEFLRAHQAEELESLRVRNRELNEQLEQVQRQNRGFLQQLEQQKLIQKRTKATHELSEKELQLKELVQKQQALEQDIRGREDDMKSILQAQEEVEREIVKLKQAQKYILEQTKIKEKSRFTRTRPGHPPTPFSQDPDSLDAGDDV